MKQGRRMMSSLVLIGIGVILFVLGLTKAVDEYWGGMGSAFVIVGALKLVQFFRLSKDETYRERVETEASDERNHFIRNKAWACAGYLYIIIAAVASIGLKLIGEELLSQAAGMTVCLMIVLYWVSFFVLRKKY